MSSSASGAIARVILFDGFELPPDEIARDMAMLRQAQTLWDSGHDTAEISFRLGAREPYILKVITALRNRRKRLHRETQR